MEIEAANEFLKYVDTFSKGLFIGLTKPKPEAVQEVGPALDYLENALGKFADGPFFLGEFSLVRRLDICFCHLTLYCVPNQQLRDVDEEMYIISAG